MEWDVEALNKVDHFGNKVHMQFVYFNGNPYIYLKVNNGARVLETILDTDNLKPILLPE